MSLSSLPGFKGLKARAIFEVLALWSGSLPIGLSTSDAEVLLARGGVTRIYYGDGTKVESMVGKSGRPIEEDLAEAEQKGTVLAILQIARQ